MELAEAVTAPNVKSVQELTAQYEVMVAQITQLSQLDEHKAWIIGLSAVTKQTQMTKPQEVADPVYQADLAGAAGTYSAGLSGKAPQEYSMDRPVRTSKSP